MYSTRYRYSFLIDNETSSCTDCRHNQPGENLNRNATLEIAKDTLQGHCALTFSY